MVTLYENATHIIVTGKPKELETLRQEFRFRPDGYFFALSYQRWKTSGGDEGWDGYSYPFFFINSTTCKILRGRKEELIQFAELNHIELNLDNLLELPFAELELDDIAPDIIASDFELDPDQRRCIRDWLRAGIGFNKVTIGGGKTACYAGATAMIKARYPEARFIYMTPSERLVRQVTHEMRRFLPDLDIGQCGGGKRELGAKDMVICTVAMLNKNFARLYSDKWFDTFMCIHFDEVHHCPSPTAQKVVLAIPAYFRLGASDSAKEKDLAKSNAIRGLFGPILNDVKSAPLIASGRLAAPHLYIVDIPSWAHRFDGIPFRPAAGSKAFTLLEGAWVPATYNGPVYELDANGEIKTRKVKQADKDKDGEWIVFEEPVTVAGLHRLEVDGVEQQIESRWCLLERMNDRAVIGFKARNLMIVEWAKYFHRKGWQTIVLATRTTHVYILEALLKAAIPESDVNILIGEATPKERDEMFDWLKRTPGAILVSPLIREGVSLNCIRGMIIADSVSDIEVGRQIIGRAMRVKQSDNRAHVVFFHDRQHPVLKRSSWQMFQELEKQDGFTYYHPCAGPATVFPKDFCSSGT